ncbi:MAG: DUF262 domain-containing protein [Treponema sp.]|jgi:hypothetical protein|nr:DUF262 domain-containing protein [Treponema sp.]
MSEKTPDTLFQLLDIYKVEIPIVQRDYAQGRQEEHTKMVREILLSDMKSAIMRETQPLDLNFVYGKVEVEAGKFIPIDGQQRLTTLFILHLYAFHSDDSKTNLMLNFTYETRTSSRDFLKELIRKRNSVFASALTPSKEITDSEWFVSSWKYDPTIQSVLVMLDNIAAVFSGIEDLAERLINNDYKPIVFKFLDMKNLGMEDSLYIKLNARGKPLTPFENFKARLIGQLGKLLPDFARDFEKCFDVEWADLFWVKGNDKFDHIYLAFFGVLLMNKEIIQNFHNWSNMVDFNNIDEEVFSTAFYTLNFLYKNMEKEEAHNFIFDALEERSTYQQRVLFHSVTVYLYNSKGADTGSFTQWLRIIRNLTLNSRIDTSDLCRRAIEGINKFADKWDNLLDYFAGKGEIQGFNVEQKKEEWLKAQIIKKDEMFASLIYKAETHPYFCGQIRSALNYSMNKNNEVIMESFVCYWDKISALFDNDKPKHGHLLRQVLLTFGDYTLPVGDYITLCVDDPNETARTPSLKSLFSNSGTIVKKLLDTIDLTSAIKEQLETIKNDTTVLKNDWRYCFINFPVLFNWMSNSHMRLRNVSEKNEMIIVQNKASNGYNYGVFLSALQELLKKNKLIAENSLYMGTWADRYIDVNGFRIWFMEEKFLIKDAVKDIVVFETVSDDPIEEALTFLI